jgi:hypothetical protein
VGVPTYGRGAAQNPTDIKHSRRGLEKDMQSVQYRNMSDEELLQLVYMNNDDPLVRELCARIERLIDEKEVIKEIYKLGKRN